MISATYKAEVEVPEEAWRAFGHTPAYESAVQSATKGSAASGSDRYSRVFEWAEYPTRAEAAACEQRLLAMVATFQAQLARAESEAGTDHDDEAAQDDTSSVNRP